MGIREVIKSSLTQHFEKCYEKELAARKKTYREWAIEDNACLVAEIEAGGVAEEVVLLQTGPGNAHAHAEAYWRSYFGSHPEAVLAYGDEDRICRETGECGDPWFKPDWSPDVFAHSFYFGGLVAVRKSWLDCQMVSDAQFRKIASGLDLQISWQGRTKEQRSALWEMVQYLVKAAGGYERGCKSIGHAAHILFHSAAESMGYAAQNELTDDTQYEQFDEQILVSVIIPSKDHPDILSQALQSVYTHGGNCAYEVLVVDNGSSGENQKKIRSMLEQAPVPAQYLYEPMEFHFPKMCNLGADHAKGKYLLLLNDDVEIITDDFLRKMVQRAAKPYVGAVGIKLYYPGGKRFQHDGIINLPMGPVHKLQFMEDDRDYYHGFNRDDRNTLAVTGACLMVNGQKYAAAGGMKEALRVAFNDVDLCYTLWEQGYHNVVCNHICGYHHESLSRGDDESMEKLNRLIEEKEKLYEMHPGLKGYDPYYPSGLNTKGLDTGIRPAYLTAGNRVQKAVWERREYPSAVYRKDACLLLRIEQCDMDGKQTAKNDGMADAWGNTDQNSQILGYCVVLGDNNACYQKELLLGKMNDVQAELIGDLQCYAVEMKGQYRPDLVENMPDQKNVGLCGFHIDPAFAGLEPGVYRIGAAASHRFGKTRLIQWSNRVIRIG